MTHYRFLPRARPERRKAYTLDELRTRAARRAREAKRRAFLYWLIAAALTVVVLSLIGCAPNSAPIRQSASNAHISADGITYIVDTIGAAQCVHVHERYEPLVCTPLHTP